MDLISTSLLSFSSLFSCVSVDSATSVPSFTEIDHGEHRDGSLRRRGGSAVYRAGLEDYGTDGKATTVQSVHGNTSG